MTRIRTSLLMALLIASVIVAAICASRMSSARQRAELSGQDLQTARVQLAELRANANRGVSNNRNQQGVAIEQTAGVGGISDLLRQTATTANLANKLTGIEPGAPSRIEGTDYSQTPIFLRLDALPIRQLVMFLHESATRDPAARCQSIELAAAPDGDLWTADVTIGYLSYSPQSSVR